MVRGSTFLRLTHLVYIPPDVAPLSLHEYVGVAGHITLPGYTPYLHTHYSPWTLILYATLSHFLCCRRSLCDDVSSRLSTLCHHSRVPHQAIGEISCSYDNPNPPLFVSRVHFSQRNMYIKDMWYAYLDARSALKCIVLIKAVCLWVYM